MRYGDIFVDSFVVRRFVRRVLNLDAPMGPRAIQPVRAPPSTPLLFKSIISFKGLDFATFALF